MGLPLLLRPVERLGGFVAHEVVLIEEELRVRRVHGVNRGKLLLDLSGPLLGDLELGRRYGFGVGLGELAIRAASTAHIDARLCGGGRRRSTDGRRWGVGPGFQGIFGRLGGVPMGFEVCA
jgi:hypothetical protein